VFTVWEGITKLQLLFARGIESFDSSNSFVELHDRRAKEAAQVMDEKYVVSWFLFEDIVYHDE
jgi:hypothetical protein